MAKRDDFYPTLIACCRPILVFFSIITILAGLIIVSNQPRKTWDELDARSRLSLQRGQPEEALRISQEALRNARHNHNNLAEAITLRLLFDIKTKLGLNGSKDLLDSIAVLKQGSSSHLQVTPILHQIYRLTLADNCLVLAEWYNQLGKTIEAQQALDQFVTTVHPGEQPLTQSQVETIARLNEARTRQKHQSSDSYTEHILKQEQDLQLITHPNQAHYKWEQLIKPTPNMGIKERMVQAERALRFAREHQLDLDAFKTLIYLSNDSRSISGQQAIKTAYQAIRFAEDKNFDTTHRSKAYLALGKANISAGQHSDAAIALDKALELAQQSAKSAENPDLQINEIGLCMQSTVYFLTLHRDWAALSDLIERQTTLICRQPRVYCIKLLLQRCIDIRRQLDLASRETERSDPTQDRLEQSLALTEKQMEKSLKILPGCGDCRERCHILWQLGLLASMRKQPAEAYRLWQLADEIGRNPGCQPEDAILDASQSLYAEAALACKNYDAAIRNWRAYVQREKKRPNMALSEMYALCRIALASSKDRRLNAAIEALDECLDIAERTRSNPAIPNKSERPQTVTLDTELILVTHYVRKVLSDTNYTDARQRLLSRIHDIRASLK